MMVEAEDTFNTDSPALLSHLTAQKLPLSSTNGEIWASSLGLVGDKGLLLQKPPWSKDN